MEVSPNYRSLLAYGFQALCSLFLEENSVKKNGKDSVSLCTLCEKSFRGNIDFRSLYKYLFYDITKDR